MFVRWVIDVITLTACHFLQEAVIIQSEKLISVVMFPLFVCLIRSQSTSNGKSRRKTFNHLPKQGFTGVIIV